MLHNSSRRLPAFRYWSLPLDPRLADQAGNGVESFVGIGEERRSSRRLSVTPVGFWVFPPWLRSVMGNESACVVAYDLFDPRGLNGVVLVSFDAAEMNRSRLAGSQVDYRRA